MFSLKEFENVISFFHRITLYRNICLHFRRETCSIRDPFYKKNKACGIFEAPIVPEYPIVRYVVNDAIYSYYILINEILMK
jgi:hypothetical protein